MKPQDIERLPWTLQHEWTTPEFRAVVIAFMKAFVANHNWAVSWAVVENVIGPDINKRIPQGPTGDVREPKTIAAGFRDKYGPRVLALRLNGQEYEVGLEFQQGPQTDVAVIDFKLDSARISFEADRRLRIGALG